MLEELIKQAQALVVELKNKIASVTQAESLFNSKISKIEKQREELQEFSSELSERESSIQPIENAKELLVQVKQEQEINSKEKADIQLAWGKIDSEKEELAVSRQEMARDKELLIKDYELLKRGNEELKEAKTKYKDEVLAKLKNVGV